MNDKNEKLFEELIAASRILVTTCNIAAKVLSEEFEASVTGPMESVKEILDRCPKGGISWDGSFHLEDLEESYLKTPTDEKYQRSATGISIKHIPSGLSVESKSYDDISTNRMSAIRALQRRVAVHVVRQRQIGAMD